MRLKSCILIIFLTSLFSKAQDLSDGFLFSQDEILGTARFRAMSGAFGALGGDMSAVNINPAGSVIFSNSSVSASLGFNQINNDVNFLSSFRTSDDSDIDIQQFGGVFVFENTNQNSDWKKFSLAIAYDTNRTFNNQWNANGVNSNSIDQYFLANSSGVEFGNLKLFPGEFIEEAYADIGNVLGFNAQQAFLGYWAGIIDPVNLDDETNDNETNYVSNTGTGVFNQNFANRTSGYSSKLAFNFATSYKDRIMLGINLNAHIIDYEKFTRFTETNNNDDALVNNLSFENLLTTTGGGFSFQLGGIFKITNQLRAGVSYQSPTWFRLNEELRQGINSNIADPEIGFISDVLNIYPEYRLRTPGKLTGSLAYIFGKKGLISFDYSTKDYTNLSYRPSSDAYFSELNTIISETFTTASTYRIGGEYRYKQMSFRGGYRFEESPYKDKSNFGDLNGYSLGLGYKFGEFNADIAFSTSERTSSNPLFNQGLSERAIIDNTFTDIILTLSFNL